MCTIFSSYFLNYKNWGVISGVSCPSPQKGVFIFFMYDLFYKILLFCSLSFAFTVVYCIINKQILCISAKNKINEKSKDTLFTHLLKLKKTESPQFCHFYFIVQNMAILCISVKYNFFEMHHDKIGWIPTSPQKLGHFIWSNKSSQHWTLCPL